MSDHFGTLCIKGLNIIESFWYNTHQRFDHDSQFPKWQNINADVTQTLVLRLLFCRIFNDDLPPVLSSDVKLFVDTFH